MKEQHINDDNCTGFSLIQITNHIIFHISKLFSLLFHLTTHPLCTNPQTTVWPIILVSFLFSFHPIPSTPPFHSFHSTLLWIQLDFNISFFWIIFNFCLCFVFFSWISFLHRFLTHFQMNSSIDGTWNNSCFDCHIGNFNSLVVELGSYECRFGYSGDDIPQVHYLHYTATP